MFGLDFTGWMTVAGLIVAVVGVWYGIKRYRLAKSGASEPKLQTETRVTVTSSANAKVAGRDFGGGGGDGAHKSTVKVEGSKGATVAGRDVGRD